MAHSYAQSLWDAGNGGGDLNRSHVPFGQSSVRIFPQRLRIRLMVFLFD
jgi:hypothetical protein